MQKTDGDGAKNNFACLKNKARRIGVFGGSFDPVHNDHIRICELFIKAASLDELIIMPAFLSPFKSESGASAADRSKMLEIAFKPLIDEKKAIISNEEIERAGKSYTFETILSIYNRFNSNESSQKNVIGGQRGAQAVSHTEPQAVEQERTRNVELYLLIGEDSALTFDKWKNPRAILSCAKIAIAGRAGGDLIKTAEYFERKNRDYLNEKPVYIPFNGGCASSLIREYIKLGLNAEKFLPRGVCEYIRDRGLYKTDDENYVFMRKNSTEKRLEHTAGVIYLAEKYAKKLGVDEKKAATAALLHDCAKYLDYKDYPAFVIDKDVPPPVVHQFLGAYVAKNVLKITDEEILSAIRWHTTGRENMTALEKIIFTADLLEPSRTYGEVDELRAAVEEDFEKGFVLCVERIYGFLKKDDSPLYMTDKTYAYYCGKNKQ